MGVRGFAIGAVVLAVVAGGAVVADRTAAATTRDTVARELTTSFEAVHGRPDVTIGGFPFLTQLLAGKLSDITVHVDGLTFDGVAVTDVDVDAVGVTTAEPYRLDRAVLTATLPVAALQQLIAAESELDLKLSLDGDQLKAATKLLGLSLIATLVPRVAADGIRVDVEAVTVGGLAIATADLPSAISAQLTDVAVPISGLPAGVAVTGVAVRDGGVRITATGTGVVLPAAVTRRAP